MKKMNTTKKILVALAVMMVAAAMAAPAAMGDVQYSATVGAGQNTVLTEQNGNFGPVVSPSENNHIDNTFNLTNSGNINATVKANFTDNVGSVYGLTNASNVIGGSNFSLQADDGGTENTLNNDGTAVTLSYEVPPDGVKHAYDAWLDVPSMMPAGAYTGNVRLTFSNA